MSKLQGKTVCITGADSAVGRALACAFAKEGANLCLVAHPGAKDQVHQVEQECQSMGAKRCDCQEVDLADPKACDTFAQKCDADVLINNAAMFAPTSAEGQGPMKGSPDDWDRMMAVNLKAPMRLTRHFAPKMASKGEGWIINIGDVQGCHSGPRDAAYAATKHGLRGWSMSCYEHLRDQNVRVVLIEPGNVKGTTMQAETAMGEAGQGQIMPEDVAQAAMFCFHVSDNCVPEEIVLKAVRHHPKH